MSVVRKSTPPMSSPTARIARSAISRLSGWITSVTSIAVPPVERLAVARRNTISPSGGTVLVVALLGQHPLGLLVELEPGQHVLVAGAAPRVLVHDLDELGDRAARRRRPHAPASAAPPPDQLAVDHEEPVVVALDHALDHHARALVDRDLEGVRHLGLGRQVHRDPAAVVAVDRLHHHREADVVRRLDRVLGVAHVQLLRHRQAEVGQEPGCRAPCRRRSRPRCARSGWSAPPRSASGTCLPDLDQAGVVQPDPRGCRAPRPRAPAPAPTGRASAARRSGRSPRSPRRCRGRRRGGDQLEDHRPRHVAGLEPDLLGLVAVEHLDLLGSAAGRAKATSAGAPPAVCKGRPPPAPSARRAGSPVPAARAAARRSRSPPRRGRAARRTAARERRHSPRPAGLGPPVQVDGQTDQRTLAKTFGPT